MDVPEGGDQLARQSVADGVQELGVELPIIGEERQFLFGTGHHLIDQSLKSCIFLAAMGFDHAVSEGKIEGAAQVDHFAQSRQVVTRREDAAEHEGLNQGCQTHLADYGAMAMADFNDVERSQAPDRLTD